MAEYIDREAVLSALENADPDVYEDYGDGTVDWGFGRKNVQDMINGVPAADVAPVVHAQWLGEGDGYADGALVCDVWHCSECDYCIDDGTDDPECLPKYCAGCGAKMDGGDEDG